MCQFQDFHFSLQFLFSVEKTQAHGDKDGKMVSLEQLLVCRLISSFSNYEVSILGQI